MRVRWVKRDTALTIVLIALGAALLGFPGFVLGLVLSIIFTAGATRK